MADLAHGPFVAMEREDRLPMTCSLSREARAPHGMPCVALFAVALGAVVLGDTSAAMAFGSGSAGIKALAGDMAPAITQVRSHGSAARVSSKAAVSNKPALVGTYGDWGVYVSQSPKSKICYALAQPKDRSPASTPRESAYVFISNRPGEGVRSEVSIIMGIALKDGANGALAEVGSAKYDLVAKGQNAFIRNAADEGNFVQTLKRRGSRLVIKVPSAKGQLTTDTYSLAGLGQALDRVAKECP